MSVPGRSTAALAGAAGFAAASAGSCACLSPLRPKRESVERQREGSPVRRAFEVRAACAVSVLLAAAAPVAAQVSVGVYGGYFASTGIENAATDAQAEIGDAGSFMLVLGNDLDAARELQLQFSQQSTTLSPGGRDAPFDLTVRYLHLGGTAFINRPIGPGPYAVGGIGATQFSPGTSGYGDEYKPSLNIGFGYHWPLGERVALRAEVRGFFTLVNSSGGFLCSGGCVAVLKGDVFTQYGGMLGLTARF